MKVCVSCQLPKEEEFNWRWKALGIRAKICRECQSGHQRTWYESHREQEKERVRRRRVKAEIVLCIILCSNCHRKLTASERKDSVVKYPPHWGVV
jgi:hypothetical protein